jgi:phospholipase C
VGGSSIAEATVAVTNLAFGATPNSIAPGQSTTLSWNAPNATSITIDNGIGQVTAPSGHIKVFPAATTRYTATATDASGNVWTNSVLVVVSSVGTGFTKIRHIIFFVQENRSVDNYFGQMPQYRASEGFDTGFDGEPSGIVLFDKEGQPVQPFHFQTVCHDNTPPSWNNSWASYDTGRMDGFVVQGEVGVNSSIDPHGTRVMGYYDQTDLPFYYEAATQFATSDRFFSPIMAQTIPNRMYLFAATSFGNVWGVSTTVGGWSQPTIFDALDKAGVSWRYYYQDNSVFLAQWSTWNRDKSKVWNISHWYTDVQNESTLPKVIFIERASQLNLDEHPGNNIQTGAASAAKIINALIASPSWASSMMILTFDEGGGLYDHVPPVSMPAPDNIPPPSGVGGDFKHTGFRIPIIVFSPWVKPHFVSHVNRDSTAILKLIETRFGAASLTARDAAQDDMTEFLDFSSAHWMTPPALPAQPANETCDRSLEKAPGF